MSKKYIKLENSVSAVEMNKYGKQNVIKSIAKGILMDCEGFYYTYCHLEEENKVPFDDDKKIDEYINKRINGNVPSLIAVEAVTGAFAVELALKYLTFIEKEAYLKSHNLEVLYMDLPDKHKNTLESKFYAQALQNATTLSVNLKAIANIFEDWRYFYNKRSIGVPGFFKDFVHIICDYALISKV